METAKVNFTLRPWQISDAELLAKYANNKHIADNLRDAFPHPYSRDNAEFFIKYVASDEKNLVFAICADDEAIGSIGVFPMDDVYRGNAEIGYWLAETYWNRGIITQAIKQITSMAFDRFPIHRLYAGIFEHNKASMRALEKAGFTKEAVHQKAIIKNGVVMNEVYYAKLK